MNDDLIWEIVKRMPITLTYNDVFGLVHVGMVQGIQDAAAVLAEYGNTHYPDNDFVQDMVQKIALAYLDVCALQEAEIRATYSPTVVGFLDEKVF